MATNDNQWLYLYCTPTPWRIASTHLVYLFMFSLICLILNDVPCITHLICISNFMIKTKTNNKTNKQTNKQQTANATKHKRSAVSDGGWLCTFRLRLFKVYITHNFFIYLEVFKMNRQMTKNRNVIWPLVHPNPKTKTNKVRDVIPGTRGCLLQRNKAR